MTPTPTIRSPPYDGATCRPSVMPEERIAEILTARGEPITKQCVGKALKRAHEKIRRGLGPYARDFEGVRT